MRDIREMPASGGATVLRPGMNLANRRVAGPWRSKEWVVRLTQVSGSREKRQRNWRADWPRRRPSSNQSQSLRRAAVKAAARVAAKEKWPSPAKAPAARRTGAAGTGAPICSMKTAAKTVA